MTELRQLSKEEEQALIKKFEGAPRDPITGAIRALPLTQEYLASHETRLRGVLADPATSSEDRAEAEKKLTAVELAFEQLATPAEKQINL